MKGELFNLVKALKPKKSVFDLSNEKKITFDMGELIPVMVEDVVPGDKFICKTESMVRFHPLVFPTMHRWNVYFHYYFVPNDLTWPLDDTNNPATGWKNFITGGEDGTDSPTFPMCDIDNTNKSYCYEGTLPDYMGIPIIAAATTVSQNLKFSDLPFRAYQSIYNNYYRDQNLTAKIDFPLGSTCIESSTLAMRKRCWEKDYFTACLPWTQRGTDVTLPVSGTSTTTVAYDTLPHLVSGTPGAADLVLESTGTTGALKDTDDTDRGIENLPATLAGTIASITTTINELRSSVKLQEWLENNARGGSRYHEQILMHFGFNPSFARMDIPEYLGGQKSPVVVSETQPVSNNYEGLSDMRGQAISVGSGKPWSKFFEEHGYVIGLMSVLPRTTYHEGIERHWLKDDKTEFFWPEFANLGEQEVYQQEVFYDPTGTDWDDTFGYMPRYSEYKFRQSRVHGDFHTTLDLLHHCRQFGSAPALDTTFVECDPRKDIFITPGTDDHLFAQVYHNVKAIRPMPKFGTPRL